MSRSHGPFSPKKSQDKNSLTWIRSDKVSKIWLTRCVELVKISLTNRLSWMFTHTHAPIWHLLICLVLLSFQSLVKMRTLNRLHVLWSNDTVVIQGRLCLSLCQLMLICRPQKESGLLGGLTLKALGLLVSSQRSISWTEEPMQRKWLWTRRLTWDLALSESKIERRRTFKTIWLSKKPKKKSRLISIPTQFIQLCHQVC